MESKLVPQQTFEGPKIVKEDNKKKSVSVEETFRKFEEILSKVFTLI